MALTTVDKQRLQFDLGVGQRDESTRGRASTTQATQQRPPGIRSAEEQGLKDDQPPLRLHHNAVLPGNQPVRLSGPRRLRRTIVAPAYHEEREMVFLNTTKDKSRSRLEYLVSLIRRPTALRDYESPRHKLPSKPGTLRTMIGSIPYPSDCLPVRTPWCDEYTHSRTCSKLFRPQSSPSSWS